MKPEDQIKALAELDGLTFHYSGDGYCVRKGEPTYHLPPDYNTFDAIIALIQKQDRKTVATISLMFKGQNNVAKNVEFMLQTPSQLVELLLKAKGLWK